jgi:uncharacterized protein HemY
MMFESQNTKNMNSIALALFTKPVAAHHKLTVAIHSDHEQLEILDMRLREALKHERLKEKPRAAAALNRALGHLEEFRNHWHDAVAFYAAALDLDPNAGCKRELEGLRKRD